MRKQFKKTLSLIMSLIMIMSMFAGLEISSFAEDDILNYLTYEINDGEVTITNCDTSIIGNIIIPDTIEGYPVTKIGNSAFEDCDSITEILIPDSIITIGDSAFYSCDKIINIVIPDSVTTIENHAFYWCRCLENVQIGKNVTTIGDYAFNSCNVFKSIVIPESVKLMGEHVFSAGFESECDWFVIYGTPGSIAESYAKENDIIIFVDITTFPGDPTANDGLAYVNWQVNGDEVSITYCDKSFSGNIIIPSKINGYPVTEISNSAFSECNLTGISFPDSLKTIGNNAFEMCKKLKTITIPDSVTTIGSLAFKSCYGLTNAVIGDGVTTIDDNTFYNCSLENLTIGNSVTTIGYSAFGDCSKLKSITIPDSVTIIEDSAFQYCGLTSVIIPDSVTTIGNYAFEGCEALTSVIIPDSVTTIGNDAFGYSWMGIKIEGFEIYGTPGTAAEVYANENDIPFISVVPEEPPVDNPPVDNPPVEEPPVEEPPVEEPPVEEPPVEEPPVEEPPVEEPPVEEPPVEEPPVEKPADDGKLDVKGEGGIVTDFETNISQIGKEQTAETLSEMIENKNFAIVDKNGKALDEKALVGTGSKIQILDSDGKILNEYTVCVPTDIDGNGKTSAADARLALRNAAKLDTLEGVYAMAADVTGDGKINASDARKILRISAGLEK